MNKTLLPLKPLKRPRMKLLQLENGQLLMNKHTKKPLLLLKLLCTLMNKNKLNMLLKLQNNLKNKEKLLLKTAPGPTLMRLNTLNKSLK